MGLPNSTLAIFHDHPLPVGLMPALIETLRQNLTQGDPGLVKLKAQQTNGSELGSEASPIQILSGDQITPGLVVQNAVTVYLHGNCNPQVRMPAFSRGLPSVSGALGWVQETDGHIDPFVHVDCNRLAAMLAEANYGHTGEERVHMMAGAISRVILHEWIHVASQDSHHTRDGVSKSAFSVKDLLAGSTSGSSPRPIVPGPESTPGRPRFLGRLNSPPPPEQQPRAVR